MEIRMKKMRSKMIQKGMLLCLTVSILVACGSDDGAGVRLEDMQQSLLTSGDSADGKLTDIQENPESGNGLEEQRAGNPDGNGQGNGEYSENNGQQATEDAGGIGKTESGTSDAGIQGGLSADLMKEGDSDRESRYKAYVTVLEDIYFDQKFPGDVDYGYQPGENYDVTANSFAVHDIDFDGGEELIVVYTTTYVGGMGEIIYDYDDVTGGVREELRVYPHITYYDNGVIEEQASHNHGMASDMSTDGAFWPYSLYRYDPELDIYTLLASVDAWSRVYREEDYEGNPFPDAVDVDGDGLVYYAMTDGKYELKNPMDGAEYEQWRDSWLKNAQTVQPPYKKLTTDNIYTIK